ncbi:TadE/TadG family type IV pilus assembly protein [Mesorhizobium sp. SB112]|uniref:TadE/TadG family type IV pilus assembly protein n=1 Tax=Mesorhizobium sp. SB112 TaxID=3151853 RepID=UPI0032636AAE
MAAVEFALIVPLLLCMYFVTVEVGQGIETNKKVGRVGSMVADLVAQQTDMSKDELIAIMKIGQSIVQPYNRGEPKIVVTAIQMTNDASPRVNVLWWGKLENGAYTGDVPANETTTVPAALVSQGAFLIRVEAFLEYKPIIAWAAENNASLGLAAAFDNISMKETFHLRPRRTSLMTCATCKSS